MDKKICVMGLGYIGLPTASLLATKGFQVHGVDVNENAVEMINSGKVHIYEPDLDILVKAAVQSGKLKASLKPEEADIFILAVPTPFQDEHKPDLAYVEAAAKTIAPVIKNGDIIILESTSPIGTTEKVAEWILEERPDLTTSEEMHSDKGRIYVAHCPERVLPGHILKELVENDRIIGGLDKESTERTVEFYKQFVKGKILNTNARTAEMAKLTENSFRDVNIAFANELSLICDKLNINVWELIRLANRHPRVNILQPGPGVGGHCIAVDPWFIVDAAPEEAKLIHTARNVNDYKPMYVVEKVKEKADRFKNPVIACLGLSFKANIDDLRESPAVDIVNHLAESKVGNIKVVEPHISTLPKVLEEKNVSLTTLEWVVEEADIILLLVDHDVFSILGENKLQEKIVIDTRGFFN
ncbi:nucleotide sugar dehydrogenase [Bacillus toyonensis]|jgi:UDP-N-acetyl-D-mannosaminuronic acid dehydrogenase|uniref:UDP-N-acetyl-D-mannosamine dehydrogenase n=1 Tax=Bacillus toyonensis TaxID=155322 RepID=A0AAP8JVH9_9BACI|nr:UDP-N-acetyl-D-mannosamine dehydrogenase [Bacillus toyonensis]OTX26313.1 UDP-N-acetyl-D-mannosamine dehydrogenase [Bacillus thuringiensis serovar malayensis]OUB07667.1 UDP-N-acetyl-D-mannosamine dehydrogenase [Bacillus thuringiensis serovar shandongiensis]HDR7540556.1 UDP-N-acetyl-D-mannosamine dehydrogenase [Bacillus thuringiensis]EJQ35395.1 nucleotide sugar dehydrogenase [Bacillus toyonensis]MBX0354665.1 UDP-N-acetyl-D-mannosamine dehydrogenase [Bacillus toyonensis]